MGGRRHPLKWEYSKGHIWESSLTRFLKNIQISKGLELDNCYPQCGLAIEIQGIQHDRYIEFFILINFIKQERDQLKKKLCLVLRRPINSYSITSSRIGSY
ncbi:hypothetical protein Glove_117g32 [Diversispora epigaea]|uniref:Uncharacterized protein n=1 Tax=Diversispora epigaea TaxID=1348612 RepID=A0A397J059_9GLOM|nr:hypothetical protein Glove_117g32 [Diversispora epigaea]